MFCFTLGTRPEIIKLAPLIRRAAARNIPFTLIHTGQHYDELLDRVFFRELALPEPHANLHAAAPTHGRMLAAMFTGLEDLWAKERPSVVIAEGDTNSVFAAAFTARRLGVPFAHVEAGLRSDDWTMPEEVNRVLADRLSDRLYAPTDSQKERLLAEGIPEGNILITGNTIADAVREHLPIAEHANLPSELADATAGDFVPITLHRPALVDDPARLSSILTAIDAALGAAGISGIFLVHPRTRKHLSGTRAFRAVQLHEPVGYLAMLSLLSRAKLVITDSGGLQEEAALLHVPCVTVRENTERPETLRSGGNRIVGLDPASVQEGIEQAIGTPVSWKPLYTVEHPADAIMDDLVSRYT